LTLAPNTYNISVKNAAGCISPTSQKIINAVAGAPNVSGSSFNQTDCTAKLIGNSTNLNVVITWNGPGLITNAPNPSVALTSGTYIVTVFDPISSCSSSANVVVTIPNPPTEPTITLTQPTCLNALGKIEISAPLASDLSYSIDNFNFQSSPIFNNLGSGSYDVTAKNAFGCISTIKIGMINNQPATPSAPILSVIQPTCISSTGSILVTSPIGTGFTYSIDGINYQLTSIPFSGLIANSYPVTLKNADGCVSTITQIVINAVGTTNAPILEITQPTCTTSIGSIKITTPDLGTGFTYSLDGVNFQVANDFGNLTPNTYNISVKDGGGCISPTTQAIILNAPTFPKEPKITINQPTCANPLGSIKINPPFDPSYSYSIDNINYQSSTVFDNLNPGSYDVTTRNYFGCTSTIKIAIINIAPIVPIAPTLISTDPTCLNSRGSIEVTAPLGTGFSYSINGINFQSATTFNNLDSDDYNLYVKNLDGCISNPTPITINMVPQPISTRESYYYCVDINNVTLSPAKIDTGLSPLDYSFYWTFNGNPIANTSKELDASQEGIYRVEATNLITGCEIHLTATVKKSSPATATATVGIDFDYVQTITVNITSGISEYLYQLNEGPFQESNVFNIYLGGIYTITVKDKNGCNDFVFKVEAYNFPRFFTPNSDGYNDFWNITEIPNPATSTIFIFDRMGKFLKQISPTGEGWDGTFVGKPMPATDYWFVLKYEDVSGIQKEFKSHFALKR
jgi:large repetitive protein